MLVFFIGTLINSNSLKKTYQAVSEGKPLKARNSGENIVTCLQFERGIKLYLFSSIQIASQSYVKKLFMNKLHFNMISLMKEKLRCCTAIIPTFFLCKKKIHSKKKPTKTTLVISLITLFLDFNLKLIHIDNKQNSYECAKKNKGQGTWIGTYNFQFYSTLNNPYNSI